MMTAPIEFKLARPASPDAAWRAAEPLWIQLNNESNGNPAFSPLAIKGAYVIGVIHGLCESVSCLLRGLPGDVSVLPAYSLFAAAVDLLGRCLNGNKRDTGSGRDLRTGFNWLVASSIDDTDERPISSTSTQSYTVADLVQMRHYASHGQATLKGASPVFDYEILEHMPPLLAKGLDAYWAELGAREDFCNSLARANVLPVRNWPVFQSWSLFDAGGKHESITAIFLRFDWRAIR